MNTVEITGTITTQITFTHEIYGEKFFEFVVSVNRQSGVIDSIPVIASQRLIGNEPNLQNTKVTIIGDYRSRNVTCEEDEKRHLVLNVFAQEIVIHNDNTDIIHKNNIKLSGNICKQPVLRETPNGRKIADMLLAVPRSYDRTDYIPCIVWGRNAKYISDKFNVGNEIKIDGRIQSRIYNKNGTEKTAYEVSVSSVSNISEPNN